MLFRVFGVNSSGYTILGIVRRLLRGLFSAVILNPHAIVATVILGWLLAHVILGVHRTHTECVGWELHEVLGCSACVLALTVLTCLAVGHVVITFIAGWRGNGR